MEASEKTRGFGLRTVSTLILSTLVIASIFFTPIYIYSLVVILFASFSLWEFYKMLEKKYVRIYSGLGLAISWLFFLLCTSRQLGIKYLAYLLSFSIILLFLYQFTKKSNQNASASLGLTLLGIIYISVPFIFFIKLRQLEFGALLVLYFIFVTKATDIGAYLLGIKFGKHLLIPRISPNKSLEGFIGGIVFSLLAAILGAGYIPLLSLKHIPAIGLILGIFAQMGDLAESVIKRDVGVKDSGTTIPGLGGVLDLVDSLLLSLPFYYLYIELFVLR